MRKKTIALAVVFFVLVSILAIKLTLSKPDSVKEEIHYHAGFVVFKDGKKVDFRGSEFMHIKPCSLDENKVKTQEEVQLDKGHLHGGVGDVVHVHERGAKWKDLFTNLNYQVDYSKSVFYLNGEVIDINKYGIKSYDSLVVFENNVEESLLTQSVSADRIKEIENTIVECGS